MMRIAMGVDHWRRVRKLRSAVAVLVASITMLVTACSTPFGIGSNVTNKRMPSTVIVVANTNPALRPSTSQNWSGYAFTDPRPSLSREVTAITATWQVPQVGNPTDADSSTWVGIGGIQSDSLIQAGTDQLMQHGNPYYYAWIEMLPNAPQKVVGIDLLPGDTVTVSIVANGGTNWTITLVDHDSKQTVTKNVVYQSCLCSAEWIEEAPSVNGKETTLANFTSATFTNSSAIVKGRKLTPKQLSARPIMMVNHQGKKLVVPQILENDGFSVVDVVN